ncbi:hypothetical protein TIFTF001_024523 [Ficus carica]|uniref:Uncharacterized protein n=1 Tax=Ficus carica TaxID=3494 RepID=A0AA88DGX1_FICCA|nr:hypothetical protein TIFTF001_024523 [Ficus carica]
MMPTAAIFLLLANVTDLILYLVYGLHKPQFVIIGVTMYSFNVSLSLPPLVSSIMQLAAEHGGDATGARRRTPDAGVSGGGGGGGGGEHVGGGRGVRCGGVEAGAAWEAKN